MPTVDSTFMTMGMAFTKPSPSLLVGGLAASLRPTSSIFTMSATTP